MENYQNTYCRVKYRQYYVIVRFLEAISFRLIIAIIFVIIKNQAFKVFDENLSSKSKASIEFTILNTTKF